MLSELGCAGRGHVLWVGVSGDLGTSQCQGVDQGVVQELVLLLQGRQDSVFAYKTLNKI